MATAEITVIPGALERHARAIKRALERRDGGRREWIEGTIDAAVELAAARLTFTANKAFGQWCEDNGFGANVLSHQDRAAMIEMGQKKEPMRLCLESSKRTSIRHIHAEEWSRFTQVGKTKSDEPTTTKPKSTKPKSTKPKPTKPKSDKPKLAPAEQEARAREIVRPMVAAGLSIDYKAVGKEHGISHVTVEKATRIERVLVHEPQVTVDIDTLAPSAKDKLDAAKRQMQREVDAEHAARMRNLDEEVRQRVVAESKPYVDKLKEQEAEVWSDQQLYKTLINDHKPILTLDQFNLLRKCLHQRGIAANPTDFDEAFRLIQGKKLQLTGVK